MSTNDERFFKDLGARVAQLRRDQGLTQSRLGERLSIAQQTLDHYEVGRLRVGASMLPGLAGAVPKPKQRAVMEEIESMLAQAAREEART